MNLNRRFLEHEYNFTLGSQHIVVGVPASFHDPEIVRRCLCATSKRDWHYCKHEFSSYEVAALRVFQGAFPKRETDREEHKAHGICLSNRVRFSNINYDEIWSTA